MHYENIVTEFYSNRWAIMPEALPQYVEVVNRWSMNIKADPQTIEALASERRKRVTRVNGKTGIIPIHGVIAKRAGLMNLSGGASTDLIGKEFDELLENDSVKAIVFDVDSPGGSVSGVGELADRIREARGSKPIYAISNSLMASAGYWIGSSADKVFVTPSGQVGSIGVVAMHVDQSGWNEKKGFKPTYLTAGKYKAVGNPDSPLSDETKALLQESVDDYYEAFVDAVARSRGTTASAVKNGYGEGRVLTAKRAVESGLADDVSTLDALLKRLGVDDKRQLVKSDADRGRAFRFREGM